MFNESCFPCNQLFIQQITCSHPVTTLLPSIPLIIPSTTNTNVTDVTPYSVITIPNSTSISSSQSLSSAEHTGHINELAVAIEIHPPMEPLSATASRADLIKNHPMQTKSKSRIFNPKSYVVALVVLAPKIGKS